MQTVEIHTHAQEDLRDIYEVDEKNALRILAVLEQMENDPELQDRMLDRNSDGEQIDVMRWVEQFNKGNDLYRLKVWEPSSGSSVPYRVIYAYLPLDQFVNFVVLGVVPRKDFNYEPDNEYTVRILSDYNDLRA